MFLNGFNLLINKAVRFFDVSKALNRCHPFQWVETRWWGTFKWLRRRSHHIAVSICITILKKLFSSLPWEIKSASLDKQNLTGKVFFCIFSNTIGFNHAVMNLWPGASYHFIFDFFRFLFLWESGLVTLIWARNSTLSFQIKFSSSHFLR